VTSRRLGLPLGLQKYQRVERFRSELHVLEVAVELLRPAPVRPLSNIRLAFALTRSLGWVDTRESQPWFS